MTEFDRAPIQVVLDELQNHLGSSKARCPTLSLLQRYKTQRILTSIIIFSPLFRGRQR